MLLVGTLLAWRKLNGGIQSEQIGYALDVGRFELGISIKRTKWVIDCVGDTIRERRVRLGELREGLGRLQFLSGPLEHV